MYQTLTANLIGANKRYEVLDGKQYLVVPMVSITEGVHNGTKGKLYYSPKELSKNPVAWNHKPLVVYHPEKDGEGITACEPEVVASQGVGTMFRSQWDNRLKHEAWIDEDKLKRVDNRVWEAINNNQVVEVSTGLYHDLDEVPGTWNGEEYYASVINIVPDHVAILPDQKGACSTMDGAGLLRNADGSEELSHDAIREQIRSLLRAASPNNYFYVADVFKTYAVYEDGDKFYKIGYKAKGNKVSLTTEPEQVRKMTSYVTANKAVLIPVGMTANLDSEEQTTSVSGVSQTELLDLVKRQGVRQALAEKHPNTWATEVYADSVVYFKDGNYFHLPYAYNGDKIEFGDKSTEVTKTGGYTEKTLSGNQETKNMPAPTANNTNPVQAPPVQDKVTRVNTLVSKGGWTEADKAWLSALPDEQLTRIEEQTTRIISQPINPFLAPQPAQNVAPTNNAPPAPQQMTEEQYIAQAPPGIREMLQEGLVSRNEEKARLISVITTNGNNPFNPKWLEQQTPTMLRGLARLAAGQQQSQPRVLGNYAGAGDIPMFLENQNTQTQNADAGQQVLQLPTINFEKTG